MALQQIRRYQKSTELLCRKLCVARLVREVTQLQSGPSFPANSIVGHPGGHGSLVDQAHGGHEPLCNSCQAGYHPTKGFEAGALYQSTMVWTCFWIPHGGLKYFYYYMLSSRNYTRGVSLPSVIVNQSPIEHPFMALVCDLVFVFIF